MLPSTVEQPTSPQNVQTRSSTWPTSGGEITLASGQPTFASLGVVRPLPDVTPPTQLPVRPEGTGVHIVVISGGVGGGHWSPITAMVHHLAQYRDVHITLYRADVGQFIFSNRGKRDDFLYKFSNLSAGTAKFANEWRAGHTQKDTHATIAHLLSDPSQFDLVVVNHRILGNAVADHLAITTPMHLETTDHGEMHKGWYPVERFNHPLSEDRIIVPNLTGYGHAAKFLPNEKIEQIPYGVREAFENIKTRDRADVREELGLPANKRLVVHSCGGGGQASGYSLEIIEALLTHPNASELHLVAIAGSSEQLRTDLEALKGRLGERGENLEIRGHCSQEDMAALQYAAGMSEPPSFPEIQAGGGSIGENAAMDNVVIVYQKKSGVEDANAKFVAKHDTGFVALKKNEVLRTVFETTPAQIEAKRVNVQALGVAGGAARRAEFHRQRAIEAKERAANRAGTSSTAPQEQARELAAA